MGQPNKVGIKAVLLQHKLKNFFYHDLVICQRQIQNDLQVRIKVSKILWGKCLGSLNAEFK